VIPLLQAVVLALVLPRLVRFDTPGSYVVFVFGGTVVWNFLSSAVNEGAGSIVEGQDLSTRVYFPRVVLPLVSVLASAYALLPGVVVLLALAAAGGDVGAHTLWVVPGIALAVVFAGALATLLAGLQVYFRDVRYITQAALLAWFYLTPVIYPLEAAGRLRGWVELNPLTGVVELFRAGTVGADGDWGRTVLASAAWTVVLAVASIAMHRRYDRVFVDLL
jgi:ABC-type polysaccharide/polyol phosphate export permease